MAIHSIKSILSGIVGTVLGGIILLWVLGVGPFSKESAVEPIEENTENSDRNHSTSSAFSFHSPSLTFYESSSTTVPRAERVYQDTFLSESARFIYWELNLKHNEAPSDTPFNALIVYRDSKGNEKTRKNYETTVQEGWKNTAFTWGWGSENPGSWPPDTYTVEIYYQGNLLIKNSFVTK